KVVGAAGDDDAADRRPPVLAARLRILDLRIDALTVLTHGAFGGDAAVGTDRVAGAGHDRPRQPAVGREARHGAARGHDFTGIAAGKAPLTAQPFQLDDVEDVVVGRG